MAARSKNFLRNVYEAARRIGLPDPQARLAASQAALETGYGRSVKGNNYFGIKAGRSWAGPTQNFQTWEEQGGKRVNISDKFRKYDSLEESLADWADTMERRWPQAMRATTFEDATQGLNYGKRGGYATDSKYGNKLSYIERRIGDTFDTFGPDLREFVAKTEGVDPEKFNIQQAAASTGIPGQTREPGLLNMFDVLAYTNTTPRQTPSPAISKPANPANPTYADNAVGPLMDRDYGRPIPRTVAEMFSGAPEGSLLPGGPAEQMLAGQTSPGTRQSASTSAKIAPLPSFDQMAAFSAVSPTEAPGLSLGTPIGPEVAPYGPSGPSRRLGPRGVPDMAAPPSMPSPAPMSMTQLPALDPAVEIASRPTATIAPPQPAPMLGVPRAKPGMSPPPLGGSVLPREKPARPTPQKRFAPMAAQLAGGLLGGFLGGPVGALGGAFVGRQLGRGGLPQMGPLSIGSIVNQGGFERTPVGGASRVATQGGGFDNRAFTKSYADLGGSSDPHSYSRALAEEQRQRSRAGQKTVMDAFGGLFR